MIYGSLFSGIEAASVAWMPLGWRPAFFSEIDPFCCAVLRHHYPEVENRGDITEFRKWPDTACDLLVGGSPCQSFSVAGLRKGLDDPRGHLTLTYLAVAARIRPRWLVWENVPGVLSVDKGRTFATFLSGLAKLGYGFAYRVLDAQYFGVPQRRRRVFVVGHLGNWRAAAAVLFERQSLSWHPAPRRKAREEVALPVTSRVDRGGANREARGNNLITGTLASRTRGGGGLGTDFECDGGLIAQPSIPSFWDGGQVCQTLDAVLSKGQMMPEKNRFPAVLVPSVAHALRAEGCDASEDGTGRGVPLVTFADVADPIAANQARTYTREGRNFRVSNVAYTATTIRRLTPRECERLQGLPDDYTLVPYRNKLAADGPRYKAIGNSMAVPCVRWIGERIAAVDEILRSEGASEAARARAA